MLTSESVALTALGYKITRDVKPGEAVVIDREGNVHSQQCSDSSTLSPCIFEFVYFARPDSIIDNISVYKSRLRMGEKLAEKIKSKWSEETIDVVMPVPDTSRTAALQLANELDLKYREGFIKNRYIARTFIMPGQKQRKKSVRQKLSAIELEFKGKNVLLVDDSIVRGTTSREIVQMARVAGAKKVFFASAAPPVRYPNVYGIDMASKNEFVAHNKTTDEVCQSIGADKLIYQNLKDLIWSVQQGNPDILSFDCSCFDGKYLTKDIDTPYLDNLEARRSDQAKQDNITNESSELIYNDAD
jgi:amidophosphoribosyltransferase